MKKALVILLILAVAGGVFAQGLAFTGLVGSGVALQFTDMTDSKPQFGFWSVKNGYGARMDLNGAYVNEAGTAGAKFNLRAESNSQALAFGNLDYAFAWFKLFDGALTLNAGDVSAGSYGTGGGVDDGLDTGSNYGLFVQIAPIAGLEFGLGTYYAERDSGNNWDLAENMRLNIGFTFTAEELLTVIGNLRFGGQAVAGEPDMKDMDATLGFKVLALADAGVSALVLDFGFYDLMMDRKTIKIGEKIEWTDSTITVGGRFMQQLRMGGTEPTTYSPDLSFGVYGSYKMDTIIPRLDVGFNVGTSGLPANPRNGMWDVIVKDGFTKDAMNLGIAPSIQFQIDGSSRYIELGYVFQKDLTTGATANATTATMRNTIYAALHCAF